MEVRREDGVDSERTNSNVSEPRELPFFSGIDTFKELWTEIADHIDEVVQRGKYSHGAKVAELERSICEYTGARHAIGVASGTDALTILLRACGIGDGDGDEVIVPAFSFIASASSVVLAGATPRFADIDPTTYAMAPDQARVAVSTRTRGIMPAHLFVQMADMDALVELARDAGLILIEDSAEAIGMTWRGKHAGLLGVGGILSFFPTKTLGALGDAGMIITNDTGIAQEASILRHHGRMGKTIDHIAGISNLSGVSGMNSKMDDIQAAILLAKLTRLEHDIATRERIAHAYTARLGQTDGILMTPETVVREGTSSVYYVYVVEVEGRDRLVRHLRDRGIETEVYYPLPLHLQPCFRHLGYKEGDFPVAERACKHALALPLYPDMSMVDVDYVCDAIRDFYSRA